MLKNKKRTAKNWNRRTYGIASSYATLYVNESEESEWAIKLLKKHGFFIPAKTKIPKDVRRRMGRVVFPTLAIGEDFYKGFDRIQTFIEETEGKINRAHDVVCLEWGYYDEMGFDPGWRRSFERLIKREEARR